MEYKKLPRERDGFLVQKQMYEKQPAIKKESSMIKEINIESTILDRDDQLNLMMATLNEVIVHLGLDVNPTPIVKTALDVKVAIEAELAK